MLGRCADLVGLGLLHGVFLITGDILLGRDVWSWATAIRLDRVTADSRLGRRLSKRDQLIGAGPRRLARRHGIRLRPRVTQASDRVVTFADGDTCEYDTVVWATGFTTDNSWIDIPGLTDQRGRLRHSRGVTASPGLYTLGLTWQHTRGSALLGWVGTTPPTSRSRSNPPPHEHHQDDLPRSGRSTPAAAAPPSTPAVQQHFPTGAPWTGRRRDPGGPTLASWRLPRATVHALRLILIASLNIGFSVTDERWKVAVETGDATEFRIIAAAVSGPARPLAAGLTGH
jgi:hypothetical protein